MSKKANPTAIGAFVVAAVALAACGILIFGSGRFLAKRMEHVMFFEGSLSGLSVGAPVQFNGVKIGSVTNILISYSRKHREVKIPVFIEIDPGRIDLKNGDASAPPGHDLDILIKKGLRAQLKPQSLVTGQLLIEMAFHPDSEQIDVERYHDYAVIPTIPSDIDLFIKTVEELPIKEIAQNISHAAEGIDKLINGPELYEAITAFTRAFNSFEELAGHLNETLPQITAGITGATDSASKLLGDLDDRVGPVASAIERAAGDAAKLARDGQTLVRDVDAGIRPILSTIRDVSGEAGNLLRQAESTLSTIERQLDDDSPLLFELSETFKELSAASRSIRIMADYIERHPEALLKGKGGFKGLQELRR